MGRLPTDWLGCPKIGEGLIQGLFLTFKTPLSADLNSSVEKDLRFRLDDVFSEVERLQVNINKRSSKKNFDLQFSSNSNPG